jgi:hypothetical protein
LWRRAAILYGGGIFACRHCHQLAYGSRIRKRNRPTEDASMMEKKPAKETKPSTAIANDPEELKGTLNAISGSHSNDWNNVLANQTFQALWLKHSDPETRNKQYSATVAALIGIGPKDELEGMMAAQLIVGSNSAASSSGDRPACTSSTICRRNSGV